MYAQCLQSVFILLHKFLEKLTCNYNSASLPVHNSSLYTLAPKQLQQSIEQLIAAQIWMGIFQLPNSFF